MHIIVKLMPYYLSIVKVTDAHTPVYISHARTLWMNQMLIHTLLVNKYIKQYNKKLLFTMLPIEIISEIILDNM